MKIRMRELRNVIRRVISENNLMYEDFDIDDFDADDLLPSEDIQDEIQAFIHDELMKSFAVDGDIEGAIAYVTDQAIAKFPDADLEMIEDIVSIEAEAFDDNESVTGPASFRPAAVNQNLSSIRTTSRYD